jgi:hypothetical protein
VTFQLTQAPTTAVSVALSTGIPSVATIVPSSITLGSDNWDTGITATVTAVGSGLDVITLGTGSDSGLPPSYYVYVYVDPYYDSIAVCRARAVVAKKPIAIAITPQAAAIQQYVWTDVMKPGECASSRLLPPITVPAIATPSDAPV